MVATASIAPTRGRDPSGEAGPERVRLLGDDGRSTRYGVLECPQLARGKTTPRFSLVVLLARTPGSNEGSIRPLIASSYVGMELDYTVPRELLEPLNAQPLYARAGQISLHGPKVPSRRTSDTAIASVAMNAPRLKGALHAHLGRDATLDVLDALSGLESSLVVRARIEFRSPDVRHVELECTLDAVLGDALTEEERTVCVRLVGPGGNLDGGILLEQLERSEASAKRGPVGLNAMIAGNRIQTVAATLQPSVQPVPTAHLLATEAIRIQQPVANATISHFMLPAAVFLTPAITEVSLPIITDLNAPLLADKTDAATRWYLPQCAIVKPAPNASPDTSPFLFSLERIGSSASGQPAVRATIRFTCELTQAAEVQAAIKANPRLAIRMVEPLQLSVALSVPFIDDATGTLKRATYQGVSVRTGDRVHTTIELLNDAARITYGALSTPDFQSEPARLEVSYQFAGYAAAPDRLSLVSGGKISQAVVLPRTRDNSDGIFIAMHGREQVFRPQHTAFIKPDLSIAGRITTSHAALALPTTIHYVQRTSVRQQSLDVFMSCAELGAFYREKQNTATVALGCAEAYKLGQASQRTYQEITALNHESYRVFRNVQQPGRFLLVPLMYAITRYAPSVPERAYRPALIVYAALDAERPANNRIRFEAMLGPTIPSHVYEALRRKLKREAQDPVLELPNMLAHSTAFRWNLTATPPIEATTSSAPDNVHVALATDLASALLLRTIIQNTGLTGEARFTLEDGSVLTSALSVHLGRVVGPWAMGPVAVQRTGTTLKLSNRIESSVAVNDVYLYRGTDTPHRVAVEKTVAPSATIDVDTEGDYATALVDAVPLSDTDPTFEEVRAMVEEIQCNVVFVDLVNYANHSLTRLDIDARLRGVPGVSRVAMAERRGTVDFLLPLTTYLATRVVEFRVTKTFADKPAQMTGWIPWDMETSSNVVTITSDTLTN